MKISIKFLKKLANLLKKCNKEDESDILKKNYIIGFANLSSILKQVSPIKNEIKEKFLLLCLNFDEYKKAVISNLNDEILGFMKKDHRNLLSISRFSSENGFQSELVFLCDSLFFKTKF